MAVRIGFILLTHTKPEQIRRLVHRLNGMFDQPPIVCHHDFAKCTLPIEEFPSNVSFVLPHVLTGWAVFPVVEATVRAIRLMYQLPEAPDWFVFLSGADYPIKPAAEIRRELAASPYDAYIEHTLIQANQLENSSQRECYNRYCVKRWSYPSVTKRLRQTRRILELKHPLLSWPFLPFSTRFRCYSGEFYFCANRRAADYILHFHATRRALASHYQSVHCPEESYFQCILANALHLKLHNDTRRYIDWSAGGSHPKTLGIEDLPRLLSSAAHFARKFDIDRDARILDELDSITAG
jgi:Core-2/I-Branching enzyme